MFAHVNSEYLKGGGKEIKKYLTEKRLLNHHAVSEKKDYWRGTMPKEFSARRSDATCPLSCQIELRSVKSNAET